MESLSTLRGTVRYLTFVHVFIKKEFLGTPVSLIMLE